MIQEAQGQSDGLLRNLLQALDCLGHKRPPYDIDRPKQLVDWLVQIGVLDDDMLAELDDELSAGDLVDALARFGVLTPALRGKILARVFDIPGDWCEDHRWPPRRPPPPAPAVRRARLAVGAAANSPFVDQDRLQTMLAGLAAWQAETPIDVRFSNTTGLVRSLRGDLFPDQLAQSEQGMIDVAQQFASQRPDVLLGTQEYPAENWRPDTTPTVGSAARLRQTDRSGIPVLGGVLTAGFRQDGRLTYVSSTAVPVAPDADFADRFQITQEKAFYRAKEHVIDCLITGDDTIRQDLPPKPDELEALPADDFMDGMVVFPLLRESDGRPLPPLDLGKQLRQHGVTAEYRPGWAVLVIDKPNGRFWTVVVDGETGEVLAAREDTRSSPVQGCVYPTIADARQESGKSRQLDTLDGTLSSAPDFPMSGSLYAEPVACGDNTLTDNSTRAANVYYHLCRTRDAFDQLIQAAWTPGPGNPPTIPGAAGKPLPVELNRGNASARYLPDGTIVLWEGNGGGNPPYGDPALDPDVIAHEYTHAVFHVVQPDLMEPLAFSQFNKVIDEGLAFYFACALNENISSGVPEPAHRWGKVAYLDAGWDGFRELEHSANQKPGQDFLSVCGVFPQFPAGNDDPDGDVYAASMVWARALWDVRRTLDAGGVSSIANEIILRGLSLAGGAQTELETPAEAIIHVDSEREPGSPSHETALRLIFCSRGIMADSPIHEIETVTLDGTTVVLAAAEGGSQGSGCLFSTDDGASWSVLGTDGPQEVVALAVLETNNTRATVWAAAESRAGNGSGAAQSAVYRYDLALVGGSVDDGRAWSRLPDLPTQANILSMAATSEVAGNPASTPWLFVGTEAGLYKFDGAWPAAPNLLKKRAIFGLEMREKPGALPRRLLAATADGPWVIDPGAMARDQNFDTGLPRRVVTLSITAGRQGTGHIWAGTAFDGVYHFDPNPGAPSWVQENVQRWSGGVPRPVFHLLVEQDGSRVYYAGTDDGVYHRNENEGEDWHAFNTTTSQDSEAMEGATVGALLRIGGALLAGTAQRGLWRRLPQGQWSRITSGLCRIGRLTDTPSPDCNCFRGVLRPYGSGTHVLHVTSNAFSSLSLVRDNLQGQVTLKLFYVAPCIDTSQGHLAGLQERSLQLLDATNHPNRLSMAGHPDPGYYLIVATASNADASYRVVVDLQ